MLLPAQPRAQEDREILVRSREGANITEGELLALDERVSPRIQSGQSVYHILVNNSHSQ